MDNSTANVASSAPGLRMTKATKAVLAYYRAAAKEAGAGQPFYRSLPHVAKDLGISARTVARANDVLHAAGLIVWKRGFGSGPNEPGCSNLYWMNDSMTT
jgi:hypothetical protein